jgi:ubiquinone/menaquinone biosynthesis C-methylase UbiE
MLKAARVRVQGTPIIGMSATQLEFTNASFDTVLFSFNGIDCIYPVAERRKVFSEVKRVLIQQRFFYFSSHNIFGQFGRNIRSGLNRGLRTNLLFLLDQLKNTAIRWIRNI